jgi:hypothetical protein
LVDEDIELFTVANFFMNLDDFPAYIEREQSASLPSLLDVPTLTSHSGLCLAVVPGILSAIRQLDNDDSDVFH